MSNDMLTTMFDENVRAETILHLGTMCQDDSFPQCAEDAFNDFYEEVWKALGRKKIPDDFDAEEHADWLRRNGKQGFLIQFATPIPTEIHGSGYTHDGWGYYMSQWVYDDSFDGACAKGVEWAAEYVAKARIALGAKP